MKSGPGTFSTVQIESESAIRENWTRRTSYHRKWVRKRKIWKKWTMLPQYRPKWVWESKTLELDPTPLALPKMSQEAQNMKNRLDAVGTVQNEFGSTKRENSTCPSVQPKSVMECKRWKLDLTLSLLPKTSPKAQNMKMTSDALSTSKNEFGSAKHDKWTSRPWYRPKRVRERKTWKLNLMPLVPSKNESGNTKYENWTRRPRYRLKGVPEHKTWKLIWHPWYRQKWVWERKTLKVYLVPSKNVENGSRSAKHEKLTSRPWCRPKWVRERKTWILDPLPSVSPNTSRELIL
jgi:hypothetical protein